MVLRGFAREVCVRKSSTHTGVPNSKFIKRTGVSVMEFPKNASVSSIGTLIIHPHAPTNKFVKLISSEIGKPLINPRGAVGRLLINHHAPPNKSIRLTNLLDKMLFGK